MAKPTNKEKLVAFDGVLFRLCTQRFPQDAETDDVAVHIEATHMEQPEKKVYLGANYLTEEQAIITRRMPKVKAKPKKKGKKNDDKSKN